MAMIATAIYLGLVFASGSLTQVFELYGPFVFLLANGLRLLGGIAGGVFAQKTGKLRSV